MPSTPESFGLQVNFMITCLGVFSQTYILTHRTRPKFRNQRDLLNKRDQNMEQTTPNLEKAEASQQPQTCTGYCGVEPDEFGSSIVDESSQLKDTGINSNLTPDQSALKETLASDSEQQTLIEKKASDINQPILPLKIPDVTSAGNMSSSDSITTSTAADSSSGQNMTAQEKITEPKSFIVTQSNGLESQSVNRNAGPQEETKDHLIPLHHPRPHPPVTLSDMRHYPPLLCNP